MTYFDCFVAVSWTFVIGWYVGALCLQNRDEKGEGPCASEEVERYTESEAQWPPAASSASAD